MRRERRPDRAVYIPRARRSQTTPPNTATTQIQASTQLQQPSPHQQQPLAQLPILVPTPTGDTSKCLNQQMVITLDDTTTDSVNTKPWPTADEVGKVNNIVVFNSTCNNNLTKGTSVKKKEKLNNAYKDSREQQREHRLLRKLSNVSPQHIQIDENNQTLNQSSINTISNNENDGDKIKNEAFILDKTHSSVLINNGNYFSELNDNINNYFKCLNCDSIEESILNPYKYIEKNEINDTDFVNTSTLNTFSESQFLHKPVQSVEVYCKTAKKDSFVTKQIIINSSNIDTMAKPLIKTKPNKLNSELFNQFNLCIEDVASQRRSTKCDVEDQELKRASKEINRSNRRILKHSFISDILQIPDHVKEDEFDKSKLIEEKSEPITKSVCTTTQIDSKTEDENAEDDWENMYNDSGDCLDPKIMEELTASVGKCKIQFPKMDYSAFSTKQSILNEEEFPHVLEVSNFPVEFKSNDLLMVFSQYKESGFDIKWVDDTHALAVFSSSRIAAEVLTMGHPFVVLKPLGEATIESRLKAKKLAASLQPYRARPETCAALARRLVTGALGVHLKTAAAERENEKRVLREAKERKLLAAKQRDEVWES